LRRIADTGWSTVFAEMTSWSAIVVRAGGGFVGSGRGHMARNETGQPAVDMSVIMAPVGAAFRTELDAPGPFCGF
jgi:hypothetical protein